MQAAACDLIDPLQWWWWCLGCTGMCWAWIHAPSLLPCFSGSYSTFSAHSFLENLPGQPQPIASFPLYWLIWLPSNLPIIFKYYLFRIHNELRNFSSGNWPHRKATPVITRAPVTCQAPSRVRIISILWLRKQKLGETGTQRTIWSLSEHSIGRLIICGVRTFLRRSLSWNLI